MGKIYLSAYCVGFKDYEFLKRCVDAFSELSVGVEFAAGWSAPGFDEELLRQIPVFAGVPVTLHAPFVEFCTVPGSREESAALLEFHKACSLYHRFGASSMVFHTHEGSFPDEQKAQKRERCVQVLCTFAKEMKAQGIQATVENVGYPHRGNVLFRQEEFIDLFDHLPEELGCLIDIGHAMLCQWDIPQVIRRLGTRIRGYHLNTNDGVHDNHFPLFDPDGVCDSQTILEILTAIQNCTPHADLILEYAPGEKVHLMGLQEDIRRLKQSRSLFA